MGLKEREALLALKKEDCEALGIPFDGEYRAEDTRYLDEKYLRTTLSLDSSKVQEYFPVSHVVPVVLEIYQGLLSIRIEQIEDGETWYPDAQMFTVWDTANDGQSFLGYAYLDLYTRRESMHSNRPSRHALIFAQRTSFLMPLCGRYSRALRPEALANTPFRRYWPTLPTLRRTGRRQPRIVL